MGGSNGFEFRRRAALCVRLCMLAAVLLLVCGCGEQLTRMEENQTKLQAMVAANARELATLSSQIHTGHAKLGEGIQNLDAQGQGIAAEVQTVHTGQQRLHETVVAGHQGLDARASALQEGQQSLQARVTGVQDTADRTASDLTALARRHAGLHETVQANQRELNNHLGAVVTNQQDIQAGIVRLHEADAGLSRDVASLAGKQDALSTAMQDNDRQIAERLTTLAAGHDKLSADAAAIADRQTALHAALLAGNQSLTDKLAILERNQQLHQTGIDRVFATANQTATIIAAMAAAQTAMQESLDGNHAAITTQIASNRQSLQAAIDTLDAKADKISGDSAAATASLQESVRISRDVVTGQMAASLQNQQAIQTAVQEVSGKTDGLGANLAAVSAEQATARETSRANQDAIISAMAGLSEGHQSLRAGIDRINGKADRIHGDLASMATEQKAQGEAALAHHETAVAQLGSLSKSQADLHTTLDALTGKADSMSSELSVAAQRQTAMQQALAAHATVTAENQETLKAGIADLNTRTQQVATDLTAMAAGQDDFRRMQQSHNESMTTRTAGLADGQQGLRSQVDTLTAATNQTALSMLTLNNSQATFQQAMQTGMNGLHERADQTAADVQGMAERQVAFQESIKASNETLTAQAAAVAENQQVLKADLGKAANVIDRAYADLTAVSLAQETLQSTLANRSDEIVARIEGSQKTLANNLDVLTATTGQTAIDVLALANGQTDLQRSIKTGNDAIITRTATLGENQKTLGNHLDVLTATMSQTAVDVLTLGNDQSKLTQTVNSGLAGLSERTDRIAANQETTQGSVDILTATAGQTTLDLIDVAKRQDTLQRAIQGHRESTAAQMAGLAESHRRTHSGMDILTATTGQTATDVMEMTRRQDALQKSMQNYAATTGSQMATLAGNHQKTQDGVDTLTATTAQTALDVIGLATRQETLQKALQDHGAASASQMAKLAQNQQQMQSGVDTLTATTAQTALDVIGVASRQETLQTALQDHGNASASQMAKLAQNQQQMQSGMDTLTATAGQTAADVIEVANRQNSLGKVIQSHNESVHGRMAKLNEDQQKVQTSVDAVTTTTGQAARDIVALSQNHTKADQAAQTGRVEMAAQLAEIAQTQQGWLQRFDTAQARIQAMADGIATLDQQLARLQGTLQAGVQNATTLLDANGKQRQQFEAGIAQDMKAMIDAITQLRLTQARLQEQMSQVQKSTQNQAETLKTTLEQMKQPPAEIKVSDAAKPAEPVVVETGE